MKIALAVTAGFIAGVAAVYGALYLAITAHEQESQ